MARLMLLGPSSRGGSVRIGAWLEAVQDVLEKFFPNSAGRPGKMFYGHVGSTKVVSGLSAAFCEISPWASWPCWRSWKSCRAPGFARTYALALPLRGGNPTLARKLSVAPF